MSEMVGKCVYDVDEDLEERVLSGQCTDRWLWSLLVDLDDIETFVLRFVIPEA